MPNIFDTFKKLEAERAAKAAQPITHLLVGLGNPGKQYTTTRHNVGFLCMDALSEKYGFCCNKSKFDALVCDATIAGVRVLCMKPQTFMNASGTAVEAAAHFYQIPTSHIIVICDDINLPVGGMRVRAKGSDGGQRGVRSITQMLGGDDTFPRIRIGVGNKPHPDYDLADWVLSSFVPSEMDKIKTLFPIVAQGVEHILQGDTDKAMQVCNRKA